MNADNIIYKAYNFWRRAYSKYYPVMRPYEYKPSRYEDSFMSNPTYEICNEAIAPVKRTIFCFWTGDNEMPVNRKHAFDVLVSKSGVDVCLVTNKNLNDYILDSDPLPDCYYMLSDVHRADYLRTYFMHYYGGGYSDIKETTHDWNESFDLIDNNPDCYICSYRELSIHTIGNKNIHDKALRRDLWVYYKNLAGNCAYICRPGTAFTLDWLNELKRRIEFLSPELIKHPALDPYGSNADYPVPWTYILGEIFHPLCLKYHNNILFDDKLLPIVYGYR